MLSFGLFKMLVFNSSGNLFKVQCVLFKDMFSSFGYVTSKSVCVVSVL